MWDGEACLGVRKAWRFPYPVRGRGGSPTPPIALASSLQALGTPRGFPGAARAGLA